jgi:two-component system, LytTR family, response regulator
VRALIADDEPVARAILREHLENFPGIEVVGEASSGPDVVSQVTSLNPDLLFLDINMPGLDGFAALKALKGAPAPAVIFVTAHQDRALDAFNVGASDYLLKPIRTERLAAAIARVSAARFAAVGSKPASAPAVAAAEPPRRIAARLGTDIHMLDYAEVIAFQAYGEAVYVLSTRGRFEIPSTLRQLEARLPPPDFRRIHRGAIVNTSHIRKISPLSSKRWLLKMSNGLEVIVSKRMSGVIRGEIGV